MKFIEQDILEIEHGIICHQVNCQGVMGSGIALAIKNKFPLVFKSYKAMYDCFTRYKFPLLGYADVAPSGRHSELYIANLFGQDTFGEGLQTNYYALTVALTKAYEKAKELNLPFYIPFKMASDRAGGDWEEVLKIITIVCPDAIICRLPEFSA
jgi:O-acetyl-ADP-ribose deacetylase (regulator of RNase III)